MRISTRGRYGLRAMIDLALHLDSGPVALREIANRQGVSESYLEQVFAGLRKAGLVTATRGAQGGYSLGKPAEVISVGDVLRVLEGPLVPVQCRKDKCCELMDSCVARPLWEELGDIINKFLDATSLANLAERARQLSETGGNPLDIV